MKDDLYAGRGRSGEPSYRVQDGDPWEPPPVIYVGPEGWDDQPDARFYPSRYVLSESAATTCPSTEMRGTFMWHCIQPAGHEGPHRYSER